MLGIIAALVVPQFADTTDDSKEAALSATLTGLRKAIDLYRLEHGVYPGLRSAVPPGGNCAVGTPGTGTGWPTPASAATAFFEQLSMYTMENGGACSLVGAPFKFGPYLRMPSLPENPVTGSNVLAVVGDGDLNMISTAAPPAGWKYDVFTGKLIADDPAFDHL
jgi:type II secretory pathway pseudopilin PulG